MRGRIKGERGPSRFAVRVIVGGLAAALGALALASGAQAAPLPDVNVQFGLSDPPQTTAVAGDQTAYVISFTAPSGLDASEGSAVIVDATGPGLADGTAFPPSTGPGAGVYTVGYTLGMEGDNYFVSEPVEFPGDDPMTPEIENPGTILIPMSGTGLNAPPGATIKIVSGLLSAKVTNPPAPCLCRLQVDTTVEGDDFGFSNTYEVVEGPGDLLVEAGSQQATTVGTAFPDALQAKLVDGLGDPVADETITFTAPPTGPSGTFVGGSEGGRVLDATTDADGIATASVLTANGDAGAWQVEATSASEGVEPVAFNLNNEAGAPSAVSLVMAPEAITGDGVSTSVATATVTDDFDNPIDGQTVDFASDGGHAISPTQALLGGRYRARVTATAEPGLFEVTATVDAAGSPFAAAGLAQTLDSAAPKARILTKPKRKIKAKRARFTFEAPIDTAKFKCKLDRRQFRGCKSPKTYRVKRGKHVFKVRATDHAGNTGPVAKFRFKRVRRR